MQSVLSSVNYRGCQPGELLLNETELAFVQERLRVYAERCLGSAKLVRATDGQVVRQLREEPSSLVKKESEWLSTRSQSRSRSRSSRALHRPNDVVARSFRASHRHQQVRWASAQVEARKPVQGPSPSEPSVPARSRTAAERAAGAPVRPALHSCLGPAHTQISLEHLEVKEVEGVAEKDAAYSLHLSKNTFYEERNLVEYRIYSGEVCHCRTWVLVQREPTSPQLTPSYSTAPGAQIPGTPGFGQLPNALAGGAEPLPPVGTPGRGRGRTRGRGCTARGGSRGPVTRKATSGPATYFAAVTVRINVYQNRPGRWAQILNMSTRRERNGFGTMLIAGLEELLTAEDIDVVVLYPAENGRAPAFWSSLGFGAHDVSCLPDEELVPHDQGGPLLPEFDTGSLIVLPRWEKRLVVPKPLGLAAPTEGLARRGRGGRRRSAASYRAVPASKSRVKGEPLLRAHEALIALRAKHKAALGGNRQTAR